MTYVIAAPCVDVLDKACVDECPVDCGAREPVCPVEAVYYEDDLPGQWADCRAANAEIFHSLGSPGAAGTTPPFTTDHPIVSTPFP